MSPADSAPKIIMPLGRVSRPMATVGRAEF